MTSGGWLGPHTRPPGRLTLPLAASDLIDDLSVTATAARLHPTLAQRERESRVTFAPQSRSWPSNRALLLVHGVGDYKPGDYDTVKAALAVALGPAQWQQLAVYEMYWDPISDWFKDKLRAKTIVAQTLS